MDYSDYDDEEWNLDDYNEMNEQAPEQLPLETILEENSQMKDSPPQNQPAKAPAGKARRPASGHSKKKRSISPKKRQHSPSKAIKEKPSAPLKSKTLH